MTVQQIKSVLAVAKYGNFSLAADSCYISQSSLSQQISNLERELNVRLFNRNTRSVKLTEAGEEFIDLANNVLRSMDLLQQAMYSYSDLLCGTINIGAITSVEKIHFSDLIAEFYSAYPHLSINISRGESLSLLDALDQQLIDIAFLTKPLSCSIPSIKFETVGYDEYYLIVPKSHPLARRKLVRLSEFKDDRFILHQPSQSISSICVQACNDAGFSPNIACRISASSIALNVIKNGIGIGLFASEELDLYQVNGICKLKLETPIQKEIVMATSTKYKPSPLCKAFIDFVHLYLNN